MLAQLEPIDGGLIVVLGSRNSDDGTLNNMGIERCEVAIVEHRLHPTWFILTTGGYGAHFNTTNKLHGLYVKEYLIAQGVSEKCFLDVVESRSTLEDAALTKPLVSKLGLRNVMIVTSDFHLDRTQYIFERAFLGTGVILSFSVSRTDEVKCGMDIEIQKGHEREALERLKKADSIGKM